MKKNLIFDYTVKTGSLLMQDVEQEVKVYNRKRDNVVIRRQADGAEIRHTISGGEIEKIRKIIGESRLSGGVESLSEYRGFEEADKEKFYLSGSGTTFEASTSGFINGMERYGKVSAEENLIIALGSVAEVLENNRITTGMLRDYSFEKQLYVHAA